MSPPAAPISLPCPQPGDEAARAFVGEHLSGLFSGDLVGSGRFLGGQQHADEALAGFEVAGYATTRNEVFPGALRGASGLSPYIRHGLLHLGQVWDAVSDGPAKDVERFRSELLWQEYARHWYARLGPLSRFPTRNELNATPGSGVWDRSMACMELNVDELTEDGWLVNQARMWLASHWAVRLGGDWRDGEDEFFRHLLDGSRAANRLGWQWTTGVGSSKAFGFSRWQVEKRAPGLCAECDLVRECPVENWPEDPVLTAVEPPTALRRAADPAAHAGPESPLVTGSPTAVWLTAESLGDNDPALVAHPELPVIFVFDAPLLEQLALSAKRLIFLTETLSELGSRRSLELWRGDPVQVLRDRPCAVTFAPVPGFLKRSAKIAPVSVYPYPWLRRPGAGSVSSFTAWRKSVAL